MSSKKITIKDGQSNNEIELPVLDSIQNLNNLLRMKFENAFIELFIL